MKHTFQGTLNNEAVYATVNDLNEFIQAGGDETIFVENDEGKLYTVKKGAVEWQEGWKDV